MNSRQVKLEKGLAVDFYVKSIKFALTYINDTITQAYEGIKEGPLMEDVEGANVIFGVIQVMERAELDFRSLLNNYVLENTGKDSELLELYYLVEYIWHRLEEVLETGNWDTRGAWVNFCPVTEWLIEELKPLMGIIGYRLKTIYDEQAKEQQ